MNPDTRRRTAAPLRGPQIWDRGAPSPALPPGTPVPDLRYGFSPTPPAFPGYDPAGDARALIAPGTPSPAAFPVPGMLATGSYAEGERYVIKVPNDWNGNLIVAGTPALRSEFAGDAIWGDFALARGYAYASSNKGIAYNAIVEALATIADLARAFPIPFDVAELESGKFGFRFGVLENPASIAEWNADLATLTRATQAFLTTYFGRAPQRTYAVGLSNGGAQVRSLLERYGEVVDGGVEWSAVFWSPRSNILTYVPTFLAHMPAYVASSFRDSEAAAAIVAAGYPPDVVQESEFNPSLWCEYYANQPSFYSDLTTFIYALLLDPAATSRATPNGCAPNPSDPLRLPGTCDGSGLALPAARAAYVPSARAAAAVASFEHTGAITKPLVSIAGDRDILITAPNNATPYLARINETGNGGKYWQYIVSGGTHVDTFVEFGYGLQPQLPFAWAAFDQLVAIVERGLQPPGAGTQHVVSSPHEIRSA